jgi:hypothetical protein
MTALRSTALACLLLTAPLAAYADALPLDQLKAGKWEVQRTIRKPGEEPTVRKTDYCASPKKEINRVLSIAAFLCRSEVKKVSDTTFDVTATCNLAGGITGTNHTVITLIDSENYAIETTTKGKKFGTPVERSESIKANRVGDCEKDEPPARADVTGG